MKISVVQVHAAQAMMVFILLVDGGSFAKVGQRLLPKLLKTMAIMRPSFMSPLPDAATGGGFAAAGRLGIDFAAQLQSDQPLHVGHIVEGARDVAMPQIKFLVLRNGRGKILDSVLEAALTTRNPAVGRVDIAQSQDSRRSCSGSPRPPSGCPGPDSRPPF